MTAKLGHWSVWAVTDVGRVLLGTGFKDVRGYVRGNVTTRVGTLEVLTPRGKLLVWRNGQLIRCDGRPERCQV